NSRPDQAHRKLRKIPATKGSALRGCTADVGLGHRERASRTGLFHWATQEEIGFVGLFELSNITFHPKTIRKGRMFLLTPVNKQKTQPSPKPKRLRNSSRFPKE